jgi:hypothetical protein
VFSPAIITTITMAQPSQSSQSSYWTATAFAAVSDNLNEPEPEPKEPVTLYNDDGSMYTGHVNETGAKHGQGTLKTEIYITGVVGDENSHLAKWTEFAGNWCDGLMHGHGVMRNMSGNGPIRVVYEGMWDNGVPAPSDEPASHEPEEEEVAEFAFDEADDDDDVSEYPDYKQCTHDFPNFGRHRPMGAFAIMCNACHKRYTNMQHETI